MSDIFISYKSSDRERIQTLVKALEQKGWSVWWDRTIPPGKIFDEVIEEALNAAKCVIVVWSKDSVLSEWVKTEAAEGVRRAILVPVLIDDVKIPLEFRRIQAASLVDWKGTLPHPGFDQLSEAIASILGRFPNSVQEQGAGGKRQEAERLEQERREREAHEKAAKEKAEKAREEELEKKADKSKTRPIFPWLYGTVGGLIVLVLLIVGLWKWNNSQQQRPEEAERAFKRGEELYDAKNYSSALPLFQQAAEAGNTGAMVKLGYMYEQGLGVKIDYDEAMHWYRKAASLDDEKAKSNLKRLREATTGTEVTQPLGEQPKEEKPFTIKSVSPTETTPAPPVMSTKVPAPTIKASIQSAKKPAPSKAASTQPTLKPLTKAPSPTKIASVSPTKKPELSKTTSAKLEWQETKNLVQHPEQYIKIIDWSFFVGFNGVAIIHHVKIENTSDIAYKDIKVRLHYFSGSGVEVSGETKTLPVTIPPHSKEIYLKEGFVLGGGSGDMHAGNIEILGAIPLVGE